MEKFYNVVEIFKSLQGEGSYVGVVVIFLRFSGCNRSCRFCDEDYSKAVKMTKQQILEKITDVNVDEGAGKTTGIIVLTGGEPGMSIDLPLLDLFKEYGYELHIETNGDYNLHKMKLSGFFEHITVSPKGLPFALRSGDDLKLVVTEDFDERMLKNTEDWGSFKKYYLQPDFTNIKLTLPKTIELLYKYPEWKLSVQLHKMIGVE